MPERKHGLPQVAPGNLVQLFRVLERSALVDLNVAALRKESITQAKHVHALLRALGFLEKHSSHLAAEIQACRKQPAELARRLRDGIVQRCAAYAPQLGDLSFVFDRNDDEAVRGQLKSCLAGELSINQVICSLMALRKEVRDRLALSGGMAERRAMPAADIGIARIVAEPSRPSPATVPAAAQRLPPSVATEGSWRVDEVRDAVGALQSLKMHIRTTQGYVMVNARLEQGDFEGVEVTRGQSPA